MMFLLVIKALLGLFTFDLLLLLGKFSTVHRVVRQWKVFKGSAPAGITHRVSTAVDLACMLYPKQALCLQRSFVTVCVLRSQGVSAQMVLGAQKIPFRAHAWVEVDGRPVNERSNVHARYKVWDRC